MINRKYILHVLVLSVILAVFIYSQLLIPAAMTYWEFLGDKYILNITVAMIGILIGYEVRNYCIVLGGATFVLLIYCLAFMFDSKQFLAAFFLAMYTVFLAFATLANIVRHFKEWILSDINSTGVMGE